MVNREGSNELCTQVTVIKFALLSSIFSLIVPLPTYFFISSIMFQVVSITE